MRPGRKAGFSWRDKILEFLIQSGGARFTTIVKILGVSGPQASRILKQLINEGLIVKKDNLYFPTVSKPIKETYRAEVALIHALEIFRARMKMIASFHIEGRVPYLRLSLDLYARLFPEKHIIHAPPLLEIPLEEVSRDEEKLRVLESFGLLRVRRRREGNTVIEELHFKESRHPSAPGVFYKRVGEPARITPTKAEIQEAITDFMLKAAEIIHGEAEKILREYGLTYGSLPDGPL